MAATRGVASYTPTASFAPGRTWVVPFLAAGVACVIAGGLLAAATAYVTTQKTAWATAYIVLVGGVAQIGLGLGVAWLAPTASRRAAWWSWACWNIGNAGILAGQLTGLIALTDIGAGWLVAGLVMVLVVVRTRHTQQGRPVAPPHPGVLGAFRALVLVLAVTMPIGIVLAHLGA